MSRDTDYDALATDAILEPEPEKEPPPKRARRRAARLQPLPGAWTRVPIQWLTTQSRGAYPISAQGRLWLYLLWKSHWGQKGIKFTDKVGAELGIPGRTRRGCIRRLERAGWVRVEQESRLGTMTVWPLVHNG
jgi:hypothetical protein